ncbi:hypothetical protein SPICUR_02035 [Spiribacter curvatus]|uniref:Pseudouridine synthase n=2 Tax=Spiribacter curvatus TaxID=1335757 RepID=U5T5H7_9GAMM|nr:hypothetical protein SPICUR_02035 [Spiribacter curvatus]
MRAAMLRSLDKTEGFAQQDEVSVTEPTINERAWIPDEAAGRRLDAVLAECFPAFSRSRLQRWLKSGELTVDGASPRARMTVQGGEEVAIQAHLPDDGPVAAEPIPLDIVFEDASLLVINKPAGRVVHPGAGNAHGTLQNALLHHDPQLHAIPRAGIVHRLDRDTTGLMVVAKTLEAHAHLVEQLQARTMGRAYLALTLGTFTAGGRVDAPIGRHPRDRLRMAVREVSGKPAVTHYRIEERFAAHTLLRCRLESGRTHQIRVHMASIRHPIVGDPLYGGRLQLPSGAEQLRVGSSLSIADVLRGFHRQALHAETLSLAHPVTGETLTWSTPLPADYEQLLAALRTHREAIAADEAGDGRWRP